MASNKREKQRQKNKQREAARAKREHTRADGHSEPPTIVSFDRRLAELTTLAETIVINGETIADGAPVKGIVSAQLHPDAVLQFGKPNMAALFLDYSVRLYREAQKAFDAESFVDARSAEPGGIRLTARDGALFDMLEKRIGSIVFAYSSVESFANLEIRRAHEGGLSDTDIAGKERQPLKTKVDQELPAIFGIPSPSGTTTWETLLTLEALRDRLIHLKQADVDSQGEGAAPNPDAIWNALAARGITNPAAQAFDVMSYFLASSDEQPRWFTKFPVL